MADLYSVLDLKPGASDEEVRKAYRKIALECHPDRTSDPEKNERFKVATQAYEVLSDPAARREYETMDAQGVIPPDIVGVVDTVGVIVAAAMGAAKAKKAGKKIPLGTCMACLGRGELVLDLMLVSFTRVCPVCNGGGKESPSTPAKNAP